MESLLVIGKFTAKVSSVLNRDTRQFGKKHMFDENNETCWNSDQGSPQYVLIEFTQPVRVCEISIHFQGGFVGKECILQGGEIDELIRFFPEDSSTLQNFHVASTIPYKVYKIIFENSTDFYGRITIYSLKLLGQYV